MMANDDRVFLPIGSVVLLMGGRKRLMITGHRQREAGADYVFDYCGVPFPEGNLSPALTVLFDHHNVETLLFDGPRDAEVEAHLAGLAESMG